MPARSERQPSRLRQDQKTALYIVAQNPGPHYTGHASGGEKMEFDDLSAGELEAVMLRAKTPGAAVEQLGADFAAAAVRYFSPEVKTDLANGRPPGLATLLHVLGGPGF